MRLTYRDSTVPHTNAKGELWEAYSDANYNEVINKLAAYEDAEEQGRLVILPCKVGDMLYEIDLPEYGVIVCKVLYVDCYCGPFAHAPGGKIVSATSVGVEVVEGHGKGSSYAFEKDDFGKTVFLTREEAEAARQTLC